MVGARWCVMLAVAACGGKDEGGGGSGSAAVTAGSAAAAAGPKLEVVGCQLAAPQPVESFGSGGLGLGRIGHGSGRAPGRVPNMAVGAAANIQGDLDPAVIRRYVKRHINEIKYCYEKALLDHPTLEGTVTAAFTIGMDGKVVESSATGMDSTVAACVADAIRTIQFASPMGGKVVVRYPFKFKNDDGAAGTAASAPPAPKPPPPPKPEPSTNRASPPQQRQEVGAFASLLAPLPSPLTQWTPFASIPTVPPLPAGSRAIPTAVAAITAQLPELDRCFGTAGAAGSARVMIALGGGSASPVVRVGGVGDAKIEECLEGVLRRAPLAQPGVETELACDLSRGGTGAWHATPSAGYLVIGATKAGVVIDGAPVPRGQAAGPPRRTDRVALVVVDADAPAPIIGEAIAAAGGAPAALVAVHGPGAPEFVGRSPADGRALELYGEASAVHACLDGTDQKVTAAASDTAAFAAALGAARAACGATPCPVRLVLGDTLVGSDLVAIATASRRAGVELLGLTRERTCTP